MKIIFLTAGRGSRLSNLTKKKHKSLLQVNKVPIIRKLTNQFHKFNAKKKDIAFITGYKSKQIEREFGKEYIYHYYKNYSKTNNLHTLIDANKLLKNQDTIICFSDILASNSIIEKILNKKGNNISLLVDLSHVRNGTMKVITKKNKLISIGKLPRNTSNGNFIGILKIPKRKMKIFKLCLLNSIRRNKDSYYTEILNDLIKNKEKINIIDIQPNYWLEIDNILDLKKAIKNSYKFNE